MGRELRSWGHELPFFREEFTAVNLLFLFMYVCACDVHAWMCLHMYGHVGGLHVCMCLNAHGGPRLLSESIFNHFSTLFF